MGGWTRWAHKEGGRLIVFGPAEQGGTEDPARHDGDCWRLVGVLGTAGLGSGRWNGEWGGWVGGTAHDDPLVARASCYGNAVGEQSVRWQTSQTHVVKCRIPCQKTCKTKTPCFPLGGGWLGPREASSPSWEARRGRARLRKRRGSSQEAVH